MVRGKDLVAAAASLFVAAAALAAQGPLRVANLRVSDPVHVAELDMDELRGQPFRLGWSPDGSELYVQTLEGTWADANTGRANVAYHHYVFASTPGGSMEVLQGLPAWFPVYWNAKNGQHAPDSPGLRIELQTDKRKHMSTAAPMGGDLAKGGAAGSGASAGDAAAAAYNTQWVPVNTMVYKGEIVGEFVNSVIVPGLTYGWGPPGTDVLAFAALTTGRVTIIDAIGEKRLVDGTKDALLPAWSQDGTQLAWLQKDGRKKYQLYVATLSTGS